MWYYTEPSPRALALDAYLAQPGLVERVALCHRTPHTEWIACVGLQPSDQPADNLEMAVFVYWPYACQAFEVVASYTPPLENIERVLVASLPRYDGIRLAYGALPYMRAIARARRSVMFAALVSRVAPYLDSPGVVHRLALDLIADSSADALRSLIEATNVDIQRRVPIFTIGEQETSAVVNRRLGLLRCRLEFMSARDATRAADALASVGFSVFVRAEEKPSIAGAVYESEPGPCAAVVRDALARRNERPS